ncbi:unnamed protein product [Mesocestoides corti]|uniref:Coiled-coil domain-containing protein 39 n=1 Tax=Mesocestoides corti TaxID=53468 RepID=A0A0R3UK99_MESCO|nr:unnamed protein product [Mesocestoides corti]
MSSMSVSSEQISDPGEDGLQTGIDAHLESNEDFNSRIDRIINNAAAFETSLSPDEAVDSSLLIAESMTNPNANCEPAERDQDENDTTELVVLHPDHTEELKHEKNAHLELGTALFDAQQGLSKFQGQLQKKHEENLERQARREKIDKELVVLRKQLKKAQVDYDLEYKKMTAMREEVDNLALRLYYLNNAKIEVKSDITIMQRAAEKASSELSKAEQEKLQQDMLAHRMQRTVDKLTEDCELLKEQLAAAEDEVRAGESILKDMENQVFGIRMDRKRLMAHWTTSLIGLQRRNEAYSELMRDFNKKQEELTKVSSEIEGIKRDITLEQEAHERLTIQLHRTQGEIDALNKEHERLKTRHDELQKDYTQAQRIMDETDKNLDSANAVQRLVTSEVPRSLHLQTQKSLDNEMDLLQKRLEKELTKKHELENQMDLLLREKLSANKATIYVKKMAANVHEQSRDLEAQAVILENTLANDSLAVAQIQAETRAMQEQAQELDKEIQKRTETLTKLQLNIKRANATVLRKQNSIDMLGQKLQRLLKESGVGSLAVSCGYSVSFVCVTTFRIVSPQGVELGPLEIMRNHLVKGIAAKQEEIGNLEQQWLKEQTDLMNKVKEKEKLGEDIARQQCCLSVLAKKKLRLDCNINTIERERTNLERDVVHLQNSMARLNKSIYTKRSSGTALEQENRLAEEDFVRSIREKEMQAVEAEGRLKEAIQEKEDLLAELIETERHIMLWEKKVQLVNETRHAVDSAVGKNELRAIRIEIQRMETRKAQIARQQEQLIQALEQSVQKRDTIITRNENAKVVKARQESSKTALLREIEDLRSKIGATEKACACFLFGFIEFTNLSTPAIVEYDEESEKLEAETKRLEKDLEDKYFACEAVRKRSAELNKQLQKLAETRQKNLIELQMRQHASRYWEQLLAGRYRRLCPTRQGAQSERERQIGRTRAMLAVVDRLTTEFPAIKQDLSAAWQILTDKLEQEERTEMHESDTSAT